jgi:hypothetical protein
MAEHGARKRARLTDAEWQADQEAFAAILVPRAEAASAAGVDPASAEGGTSVSGILADWSAKLGRTADEEQRTLMIEALEVMNDKRVNRFWELVGLVGDRPQPAATGNLYESMQWLLEALRALGPVGSVGPVG